MSNQFSYDELVNPTNDDIKNEWLIQDSIVFLLDGTQQMYENDSVQKCLEAYHEVVRSKCAFNKNDKLGLVLFGTKDTNCQIDNVTLLQKFEYVTVDTLKNTQNILNHGIDKYKEQALSSKEKYPLYNTIEYGFQVTNSFKTNTVSHKMIILCTCEDDPPIDDKRRIEHLVATFNNMNTELRVIGLTDSFNDSLFYKDLEIISGSCNNDNYRPMCLKDLEKNVLSLAKSISKLPWQISSNCVVEVTLQNLVSSPKYPPKVKLNKNTNEVLEGCTVLREEIMEEDSVLDDSEKLETDDKNVITSDKLVYYKTYGGEDIHFKLNEWKMINNAGLKPGIEVLAFKPIMCDPMYHSNNTYFVTHSKTVNEESRNFYRAFVSRCTAKKVMPICKVITVNSVIVCNMIPSDDDGGFYMYKIPYDNFVRELDMALEAFKYDEENKCPVNENGFYLFKKLINHMEIEFTWKKFTNPKLEKCIAHLEALALNRVLSTIPPDNTRPPPVTENLKKLQIALMNCFKLPDIESAKKRPLSQKVSATKKLKSEDDVPTLARKNQLNSLTVVDLKAYLESVDIVPKGTKSALIQAVNKYLGLDEASCSS